MAVERFGHHEGILSAEAAPLSDRQREILRLIVQHYVLTATPVGSRMLARISPLGLSDASTRNIMADLEYLGYVDHPHTSAGRTPTDKGYRVYVNDLMAQEHITDAERKAVARSFASAITAEDVLKESSTILSKLSKQLSIVLLPSLDDGILERVEIAQLSSNRILIVLVASSGRVRTVTLETDSSMSQPKIDELRILLNERLAGLSFREVKATFRDRVSDLTPESKSVLRVFLDAPERLFDDSSADRVKLSGAKHIFAQPEFQKKLKSAASKSAPMGLSDEEFESVIELLENEEVIIHVVEGKHGIESGAEGKVQIRIGSEIGDEKMSNYSLICTKYQSGDQKGIVGLIGPKRMEYARMAPLVEYVARAMSNVLSGRTPRDN